MVLEQNYEDTFTLNILLVALGNIVAATWNLPKLQHEKLAFKVWNSDRRHIGSSLPPPNRALLIRRQKCLPESIIKLGSKLIVKTSMILK